MAELLAYVERHPWWTLTYLVCLLLALEAIVATLKQK